MRLKKLQFVFVCSFFACQTMHAQLYIDNAAFVIQPGATVTVLGDVTSNADIQGTGKIILKGSGMQNINMGGFTIPNLEIDNPANATLTGDAKIGTNLLFTGGNIILGSNNLTFAAAATITSAAGNKFIVTNGTGKCIKAALGSTAFNYPVGNSLTNYSPVLIANTGTADDISVRSLGSVLANGTTGTAFTKEVVNTTWDINEAVAGGSNLNVTATWNGTDELPGFNRTKAGLSYYITSPAANVGWDLLNSQTGTATGTNPYSYNRTGITSLGIFAVGTRPVLSPLLITPKVFLEGPYNTSLGVMSDGLRTVLVASPTGTTDATHGVIPLTEPYTALGFTQLGSGGGETISASVLGSFADNSIVDWVFVQLHDAVSGAVISTRSALLQKDGDIVETDGVTPLNMAGNAAGNYYFSVKHRNHLGVRSLSTIAFAKTTAIAYNFTDNLNKGYTNTTTPPIPVNANMALLNTTPANVYGLFSGNANYDKLTQRTGGSAATNDYFNFQEKLGVLLITSTPAYDPQDFNMNGKVSRQGGSSATNDYFKFQETLGSTNSLRQHF